MKLNSHLIGMGVGIAVIAGLFWNAEKLIELVGEYRIYKKRGAFYAERLTGEKDTNPKFGTVEEVRAWVSQQSTQDALKAAATSIIPWGN